MIYKNYYFSDLSIHQCYLNELFIKRAKAYSFPGVPAYSRRSDTCNTKKDVSKHFLLGTRLIYSEFVPFISRPVSK